MKSRTLFSNLQRDNLKRQTWVLALNSLMLFLLYPIKGLFSIDRWKNVDSMSQAELIESFGAYFYKPGQASSGSGAFLMIAALLLGVLAAVGGFSYLHSRGKVDFYHSLLVRRRELFLVQVVSSCFGFVLPSVVCMGFLWFLGAMRGMFSLNALGGGIVMLLVSTVIYLLGYAIGALAMMLTGRVLVGIMGAGVLLVYVDLVISLFSTYASVFYKTKSNQALPGRMVEFLSTFRWFEALNKRMLEGKSLWSVGILVLAVAGILMLAYAAYKMRGSEAAGRSMAFSKVANVIKFLLVVPGALASGMFFRSVVQMGRDIWLVFGLVFGLLLFYVIIQLIYQLDFRKVLAQKLQFVAAAAAVAAIVCLYRFDLTGYDTYIPKQSAVAEINLQASIWDYETDMLDTMKMGNSDMLYGTVTHIMEAAEEYHRMSNPDDVKPSTVVSAAYQLKSGRTVYREYRVYLEDVQEDLKSLYHNEEFLNGMMPLRIQEIEEIKNSHIKSIGASQELFQNASQQHRKFFEILQEDMRQVNAEVLTKEIPAALVSYGYNDTGKETALDWELSWYNVAVYPSYKNSLAYLEEKGVSVVTQLKAADVKEINIVSYEEDKFSEEESYDNKKDIEKLLPSLVESSMGTIWQEFVPAREASVQYVDENGWESYIQCKILK